VSDACIIYNSQSPVHHQWWFSHCCSNSVHIPTKPSWGAVLCNISMLYTSLLVAYWYDAAWDWEVLCTTGHVAWWFCTPSMIEWWFSVTDISDGDWCDCGGGSCVIYMNNLYCIAMLCIALHCNLHSWHPNTSCQEATRVGLLATLQCHSRVYCWAAV